MLKTCGTGSKCLSDGGVRLNLSLSLSYNHIKHTNIYNKFNMFVQKRFGSTQPEPTSFDPYKRITCFDPPVISPPLHVSISYSQTVLNMFEIFCNENFFFFSGEYMMDYMNLDDKSIGMFWVVSHTMAQPACELVMSWLTCDGYTELPEPNPQANGTITVRREVKPVPISLLSGFSINLCLKLAFQMEDNMFSGVVISMSLLKRS